MFGIGIGEFMLIMIVALLVVGPDKLPGIARSMAKAYNEFRRAGNDIKKSIREMNIDGAEEVIMGTVDRIVPGRTRRDGPGKGVGATGRSAKEALGAEAADKQEADSKAADMREAGSETVDTAETKAGEESPQVVEPVSFEKAKPAMSPRKTPSATGVVKSTKETKSAKDAGGSKDAKPAIRRAGATKKPVAKKSVKARKPVAKKSVKATGDDGKGKADSGGGSET
jgi:Tat protein translocase TatB subunit